MRVTGFRTFYVSFVLDGIATVKENKNNDTLVFLSPCMTICYFCHFVQVFNLDNYVKIVMSLPLTIVSKFLTLVFYLLLLFKILFYCL